jgi:uncharacterized membrane protein YhdT
MEAGDGVTLVYLLAWVAMRLLMQEDVIIQEPWWFELS